MDQAAIEPVGLEGGTPLSVAIAERDRDTLSLVADAAREGRVQLAFQPVVQARDQSRIAFYEGLARVLDRNGRAIPAKDFIDSVEAQETGRVLDCISLERGFEALVQYPDLRLSLNLSARSIGYRRWIDTLDRGLETVPDIEGRLILEITEASAILVPELVQAFMSDLQARGVAFAIDDFGAGHTSLRYLKDFYFDILKIDGQFIRGIHEDPDNQVLIAALVSIGQHFDMFTVAESVETAREAAYLQSMGVDCLQGYRFGAPRTSPSAAEA
ncbi:MAG: EAL domain-containing protein [Pseudomonadota bacterium]